MLTTLILNSRLANENTTNTNTNGDGFSHSSQDYTKTVNSSRRSHQEYIERHEVVFETFGVRITEKG